MTEREILDLLARRFSKSNGNGPSYVFAPGVRDAAGFDAQRTADLIVMELWPSMGLRLHGFEIKSSRSDWLRELKEPEKAAPFLAVLDTWSIVAPENTILASELDSRFGLMEIGTRGLMQRRKPTTLREMTPTMGHLPRGMLAALMRAAVDWARKATPTKSGFPPLVDADPCAGYGAKTPVQMPENVWDD